MPCIVYMSILGRTKALLSLSFFLSLCLSLYHSVYLSLCLSVVLRLSLSPSVSASRALSLSLSLSLCIVYMLIVDCTKALLFTRLSACKRVARFMCTYIYVVRIRIGSQHVPLVTLVKDLPQFYLARSIWKTFHLVYIQILMCRLFEAEYETSALITEETHNAFDICHGDGSPDENAAVPAKCL